MKNTLSVYIIAQNEEICLAESLKSVQSIADEIVVVIDKSVDRTADIARSFGAKIKYFPKSFDVIKQGGWFKYENFALKCCTKDWILKLDADEALTTPDLITKAIINGKTNVFIGQRIGWGYDNYGLQDAWYPEVILKKLGKFSKICRLYKNNGKAYWTGNIHPSFYLKDCPRSKWLDVGYCINHYSYSKPYGLRMRKKRFYNRLFLELYRHPELRDGAGFKNPTPAYLISIKKGASEFIKFYETKVPIIPDDLDKKTLETIRLFAQKKVSFLGISKAASVMLSGLDFDIVQNKMKSDTIICIDRQISYKEIYNLLNNKGILIMINQPDKRIENLFYPLATARPYVYIKRKKNG